MGLESGKHIEKEIDGELHRIVEDGITDMKRVTFLKEILEHNGFSVKWAEEARKNEEDPVTYMIGVSDLTFNPVLAVYGRRLRNLEGKRVNPAFWKQNNDSFDPNYWNEK